MDGNAERYRLIGTNGSPYSVKMRAIMRYRRLAFDWVLRTERNRAETEGVRPAVIPVLRVPGEGSYRSDSTVLAYALEDLHPGQRSIIPDDPGHAFLSHLIEDMSDEWGTKIMFLYRWRRPVDIDYAQFWIADDIFPDRKGEARKAIAAEFAERQIGRMAMVGCTEENAPVIEASYLRILDAVEPHVGMHDFLFGSRPALGDFGLYGQLKPLSEDPTGQAVMRERAQRTESWVRQLDDASGLELGPEEGCWLPGDAPLPQATMDLLCLAGELYLPFLAANAEALEAGHERLELEWRGQPYAQSPFGYQAKCYAEIKRRLTALEGDPLTRTKRLLDDTGCLTWLS